GGRSIQRVDLSVDNGNTWRCAELCQPSTSPRQWSWCLWQARVELKEGARLVCRAEKPQFYDNGCRHTLVDSSGNIQPEEPVWNYRGVMSNAWFRLPEVGGTDKAAEKPARKLVQAQPISQMQVQLTVGSTSRTAANL
ncbi:Mo-co oxidoreductase dimerization domain-containing protein, partial [Endogone sp. FLAS-F59071]